MLDYQMLMYGPIYDAFGQDAVLNATSGDSVTLTVQNKTVPTSFQNVAGTVEFQDFRPTVLVKMPDIIAAGLSLKDDVLGGELVMDGKTWTVKSYEQRASPVGLNDGEVQLILSDDVDE